MRPQKDQDKNKADQILKRIQTESADDKKNRTIDILKGQKPTQKPTISSFFTSSIQSWKKNNLTRKAVLKKNLSIVLLTGFLFFSTYICWKIEEKYDKMRKTATVTKSLKQRRIEEQNERITRYLNKNEFESVPIKNEEEEKQNYYFEKEDGQFTFDTKEDLLSAIARDYQKGRRVDSQMEEELKKKGMI